MIYFQDNIMGMSGYSKAVRELGYSLSKHTKVMFYPLDKALGYLPDRIYPLITNNTPTDSDLVVWRTYFNPIPPKGKLIANIALESTHLPERMVKESNDDRVIQVWCPSEFCYNNYMSSGIIEDKLMIVPHGYDPNIFKVVESPINKKFRFLFVGGYTGPDDRKGADNLVRAFINEFKEGEAELYLKINSAYGDASDTLPKRSDIIIDRSIYLDHDMVKVYNSADCYVLPTQGEAFDMGILEAAACGLPIITNIWGGQFDYLYELSGSRDSPIYFLENKVNTPRFSAWDCGRWKKPTQESIQTMMRDVFNWKTPRVKYKGIERFTWDKAAEKTFKYIKPFIQ